MAGEDEDLARTRAIARELAALRRTLHRAIVETLIVDVRVLELIEELLVRKGDERPEAMDAYRTVIAEMMGVGSPPGPTPGGATPPSPKQTESSSDRRSKRGSSDWREKHKR